MRCAWALLALAGCGGHAATPPAPALHDDAAVAHDAAPVPAPAHARALIARDRVDRLLAAWVDSQNHGDFLAYAALYDDPFTGVRRTGKQRIELDRPGWLGERKRMFAHPMIVSVDDVSVLLGADHAMVRFTQSWASGSFHDVGPKVLQLALHGADLRIAREELLASKLARPLAGASATPPILPVLDGAIVLTGSAKQAWIGAPRLERGDVIPPRDPSCDRDPPSYDDEQDRFWECQGSDPHGSYGEFAISAPLLDAAPIAIRSWVGRKVRLGRGSALTCLATITRLEVRAARSTTYQSLTDDADDRDAIAAATLATGEPVVVGIVDQGCDATWAVPADAPAVVWPLLDAPDDVADVIKARMSDADRVSIATGPKGRALVIASYHDECSNADEHRVYVQDNGVLGDEAILDDDQVGSLVDVVDADGNGWPELVFDDGVALHVSRDAGYARVRMVRFPDELEHCGD